MVRAARECVRGEVTDAPTTALSPLPAATGPVALWPASRGVLVAQPLGTAGNQRCRLGSRWRCHGRCLVTRRRRTDLVLLLIIRRAERGAGMPNHSRSDEPDPLTVIDRARRADQAESPHPS
jgi:hypothetical protein